MSREVGEGCSFKPRAAANDARNMLANIHPRLQALETVEPSGLETRPVVAESDPSLPWFVMPLAGPFGLIVAATMTWLNLQSM